MIRVPPPLQLVARVILGGLFVYAGGVKMMDPAGFAQEIANYRLLPELLLGPLAIFLPGVEIAAGVAVITGIALRGGLLVIQAMLAVFIVAIIQAIQRGIDTSCGCFGVAEAAEPIGWSEVVRDVLMMGVGLLAWPRAAKDEAGAPPELG